MCSAMPSPTPGNSFSFFRIFGEVLDALGNVIEQLGYFFVAAIAADDRAIDFEQLRRLAQNLRDVFIFHVSFLG